MSFSNGDLIFPETIGLPNVFDCIIPKGFPSCVLHYFSNDNAIARPKEWPMTVSIS